MLPTRRRLLCLSREISGRAPLPATILSRNASLTSAISSGVRKAAGALKAAEKKRIQQGTLGFWERKDGDKTSHSFDLMNKRRRAQNEERQRLEYLRSDESVTSKNENAIPKVISLDQAKEAAKKQARAKGLWADAPSALPFSHAASEFLYGTFAVLAALKANRRKLYKLYIWCGEKGDLVDDDPETQEIVRLAQKHKVLVRRVAGDWDRMLDKMSDKRPHNGLVLEAAAIPKITAKSLEPIDKPGDFVTVNLHSMTAEERKELGLGLAASNDRIPTAAGSDGRYPFLLWLDRIKDTGNMGAIFRSAYFLGVDAVILPRHGTAPLNAVAIKASAGAAEYLPIILIDDEVRFMEKCKENGWIFYAAAAPDSKSANITRNPKNKTTDTASTHQPNTVLRHHPVVLMMGNEAEGLRPHLQSRANYPIAIQSGRSRGLIDSLNVSVASAMLTHEFLAGFAEKGQKPLTTSHG